MTNTVLERLWTLAQEEAGKRDSKPEDVFGGIVLYLEMPFVYEGYYSTPTNTYTFASTHGEGTHYGLLNINGEVTENSPVIMTVPVIYRSQANFVLGESLHEFLCLGCEVGYFNLEQLAYNWDKITDTLTRADHPGRYECKADDRELLDVLTQAFSLKPWEQVQVRLKQLHEKYYSLLELSPDL